MTTDDQLAAIRQTTFFSDLRTQLKAIAASMLQDDFSVQGQITTTVDGVPVLATFVSATDVDVRVGDDGHGNSLYQWHAPIAWVS